MLRDAEDSRHGKGETARCECSCEETQGSQEGADLNGLCIHPVKGRVLYLKR
jgi:hypothetical protein